MALHSPYAGPVDPALHRRIAEAPALAETHIATMKQFAGINLPEQTGDVRLLRRRRLFFATLLCAEFEGDLKGRPKRRVDVLGFSQRNALVMRRSACWGDCRGGSGYDQ